MVSVVHEPNRALFWVLVKRNCVAIRDVQLLLLVPSPQEDSKDSFVGVAFGGAIVMVHHRKEDDWMKSHESRRDLASEHLNLFLENLIGYFGRNQAKAKNNLKREGEPGTLENWGKSGRTWKLKSVSAI